MTRITQQVDREAEGLGIDVIDVKIRRADLPEANSQAIYQRMQTERQRQATEIRAQGEQLARGIRAQADREATVIVADANKQSEEIKGEGEAEQNRIFAAAYSQDPDFFAFYRSMLAYKDGLKGSSTRLVIAPDSDFFRYFGSISGKPAAGAAAPEATVPPTAAPPAAASSPPSQ
jgi:membrane protease subunit HflC